MIWYGNHSRQPVEISVSTMRIHGSLGQRRLEPDQRAAVSPCHTVSGVS